MSTIRQLDSQTGSIIRRFLTKPHTFLNPNVTVRRHFHTNRLTIEPVWLSSRLIIDHLPLRPVAACGLFMGCIVEHCLPSPKRGVRGYNPWNILKSIDARRWVLMHLWHKSTHFGGPVFMPVTYYFLGHSKSLLSAYCFLAVTRSRLTPYRGPCTQPFASPFQMGLRFVSLLKTV